MSDIPRAIFEVDEPVLLAWYIGKLIPCAITSRTYIEPMKIPVILPHPNCPGWFYEVDVCPYAGDEEAIWAEIDLRKKHDGAGTYDQLIADLKNPSHVHGLVGVES